MPHDQASCCNIPLLGRGFRPFFLLAALLGCSFVLYWGVAMSGWLVLQVPASDPVGWHAHEMIYGFCLAVVAGFLLTAVANWTSWAPVRHGHLLFLCVLWLAGRLALLLPGLPHGLQLLLELSFLPALTISLYVPLHKTGNARNYVFVALLSGLFVFDLMFMQTADLRWLHAALFLILAMASVIGGRIIPAFTTAGLRPYGLNLPVYNQMKLDVLCLALVVSLALSYGLLPAQTGLIATLAGLAALAHLWRGRRYHTRHALKEPLLWILHAGYFWICAGLALLAAGMLGWIALSPAWHALTVGALGSLIIGMMCRVTLGHTGRRLVATPAVTLSFGLMQLAAVLRVAGPLLWPLHYPLWIGVSAVLWTLCFLIYLVVFTPMLLKPRPDGQPV